MADQSSLHSAELLERLDNLELPTDPWWRANDIVKAILDGGCNNSASFYMRWYHEGLSREKARNQITYQLCRAHEIRTHPSLASLPPHVGYEAVSALVDRMLDVMEER